MAGQVLVREPSIVALAVAAAVLVQRVATHQVPMPVMVALVLPMRTQAHLLLMAVAVAARRRPAVQVQAVQEAVGMDHRLQQALAEPRTQAVAAAVPATAMAALVAAVRLLFV